MDTWFVKQIIDGKQGKRSHVAVVIPTYNQYAYTKKNIDLLLKQTLVPDIIVVDNDSTDGTFEKLQKEYDSLILLKSGGNYGSSGGQYLGQKYAYEAGYEYIILNDNDSYPEDSDLIETIVHHSAQNTIVSIRNKAENCINGPLHYGCYHRSMIERVGFVDPKYFLYYDDVDWYERIKKALGVTVVSIDKACFHPSKEFSPPKIMYFVVRNRLEMNRLYYGKKNLFLYFEVFLFTNLICAYLYKKKQYFDCYKEGLKDFIAGNFSQQKNIAMISLQTTDEFSFIEAPIHDFLEKYSHAWFDIKPVWYGVDVVKKYKIESEYEEFVTDQHVSLIRLGKHVYGFAKKAGRKQTLVTNGLGSWIVKNICKSFFFKKVVFIKDIDLEQEKVEYIVFEYTLFQKMVVLGKMIGGSFYHLYLLLFKIR